MEKKDMEFDFTCEGCGSGFNTLDGLAWHKSECKKDKNKFGLFNILSYICKTFKTGKI